ncbi:hypothetical protein QLX08_001398 [Tetragonisca angustula]|uniref:Uncharacterized protein n=1 Tax=Tetragonisca angustula TaxID=166442 RepID=A0AAW1AFT3_9HYME
MESSTRWLTHQASRLTCPEPYFVSEGLYSTLEELENTREVTLHVMTIGGFIEDPAKKDDFTAVSSALRQYLPERDTPFILDVDLDFFSTKNPFKTLYSRINLYDKLSPIYAFNRPDSTDPESVKEATAARNEQLTELQNLFDYLEEHRSLQGYEGEKSARYEAVELIYRELTSAYKQSEIDWKIIHDAGCTRDDTDLPHHVTTPNDLDRLINGTFRSFLTALPVPPTIVTIARSSDDDYCPSENVDQIQIGVLDELRQYLGEVDVQLAYEDEEEVH